MEKEFLIRSDSFFGMLYRYWFSHGGFLREGYRENFCHFCRVILIYVPLIAIFKVPLFWKIRPWLLVNMLILALSYQLGWWGYFAIGIFTLLVGLFLQNFLTIMDWADEPLIWNISPTGFFGILILLLVALSGALIAQEELGIPTAVGAVMGLIAFAVGTATVVGILIGMTVSLERIYSSAAGLTKSSNFFQSLIRLKHRTVCPFIKVGS